MTSILIDILAHLFLAAGLAVLGFYAVAMATYADYIRQARKSAAWMLAFALSFIALATLIVTRVGRLLNWLVS